MKKLLAILLAAMMLCGISAVAAQAAEADVITLADLPDSAAIHKGFAKINADFFISVKAEFPDATFTVEPNSQFSINLSSGKMTFQTGFSSLIPIPVTITSGEDTKVVNVTTYYEWYEYFVIVFAAGIFWIAAVNN